MQQRLRATSSPNFPGHPPAKFPATANQSQPFNLHTPTPDARLALIQVGDHKHHLICAYHHPDPSRWPPGPPPTSSKPIFHPPNISPRRNQLPPFPKPNKLPLIPPPTRSPPIHHKHPPNPPTHRLPHPPPTPPTPPPLPHPLASNPRTPPLPKPTGKNLPPGLPGTYPPAHLGPPHPPHPLPLGESPHRAKTSTAPLSLEQTASNLANLRPAAPAHPEYPSDSGGLRACS